MAHLSFSQSFLVIVSKLAVSLQAVSPLSPPFSPPHQHLASLQPTIILALTYVQQLRRDDFDTYHWQFSMMNPVPMFFLREVKSFFGYLIFIVQLWSN